MSGLLMHDLYLIAEITRTVRTTDVGDGKSSHGPVNQMMGSDSRQQMVMNQPFPGQSGSNRASGDFMFNNQMMQQGRANQPGGPGYQGGDRA